ncbi:MAG: hypothetical protein P1U83_12135 [Roseovarius sp.]|nr:hypothetical protein [Roseovarius sp.]
MRPEQSETAPSSTTPSLIMGLVNLLCIFMAIWVAFGLPVVLVVGYGLDKLITRMARRI